jgi:hypothetical protein
MFQKLATAAVASVFLLAMSVTDAEAKKIRGTQTCDAQKVDRKIGDKNYSCTHCSNSICDDVNGQISNCGIEHTYKDCEEKTAAKTGTTILQTQPDLMLDPGKQGTKKLLPAVKAPGTLAPAVQ